MAAQTATSEALHTELKQRAGKAGDHLFIVIVPQSSGDGAAAGEARTRLAGVLATMHKDGLLASGLIGDPDPYTATMNALQFFRVGRIIISTLPATKSGWLRSDLIERVRKATNCEVDHVVADAQTVPAS